jgi:hypothetical protein
MTRQDFSDAARILCVNLTCIPTGRNTELIVDGLRLQAESWTGKLRVEAAKAAESDCYARMIL